MNYLPLALITMVLLGVHYFLAKVISPHINSSVIALLGAAVFIPIILDFGKGFCLSYVTDFPAL